MHKDDLKKVIVEILGTEEMHGYEFQKQLAQRGVRTNISYLYRVLGEMETEGYLEGTRMKSALGPERKVYKLSEKGSEKLDQELKEAVKTIHVKYIQYLSKLPPQKSALQKLQRLLNSQVDSGDAVLVVASKVFYDWMVSSFGNIVGDRKIYLVKPRSLKLGIEYANLIVLDTPVENIPLKDNFVDAVRVYGEPENIDRALKELHRVLKKDGSLAFIVPYYHPNKDNYPLTIGEFVEKVENEVSEEDKTKLDFTTTASLLSRYFRTVKHYRIAHLAIFISKDKR